MSGKSEFLDNLVHESANRLHHLSMRYSGALLELLHGKPVGMIPSGHAGLREARDLIDLILFTRAEISGLTKLLLDAKVFDADKVRETFASEYEWFAQQKAKFLNVEVSDAGLVFKASDPRKDSPAP